MKGLYIVPRHAELIHSGKKKIIVKKRYFRNIVKQDMALITKKEGQGLMLGFIRLGAPEEIGHNQFKRLRSLHHITDEEMNEWWPNAKKFYSYTIAAFYPLRNPKQIKIPQGVQTVQEKVKMDSLSFAKSDLKDFIRNIQNYDPTKLTKLQIADDFRILCAWYSSLKKGKAPLNITKEKLLALAERIVRDMLRRGFKFHKEKMKPSSVELVGLVSKKVGLKDFWLTIHHGDSSQRHAEKIKLDDFLKKWDSFKIFKDGIFVCGSLVNFGETDGDIDVVVKADPDSDMMELIEWRLQRAYPEYADRIHVTPYGLWKGPFTHHVNLADIVALKNPELKVQEMSEETELAVMPSFPNLQDVSAREGRVKLMRPFYQQKPLHGREVGEIYSEEGLLKVINKTWPDWKDVGIFVGKKFDGATVQMHKDDKKVKIWTEDGSDITNNVPSIVNEIQEKPGDWVCIGEVEYYKEGIHQPRADTAGIINAKTPRPEGKDIRITFYDKLYHLGTDLHKLTYEKRREELLKIHDTDHVKVSRDEPLAKDEMSLIKELKRLSAKEGSEGAMFKKADMPYELKVHPSPVPMIKYKSERFLIAKVIAKHLVKGATKTWYYDCALKDSPYSGRTYNTSIDAQVGDHVKVVFVDISEYKDISTGKTWFNWWAPRVTEVSKEALSNKLKAHELVLETTGRITEKKLPKKITEPAKPETAKGFSKITYEEEAEIIRENKKKPEAYKPHKFKQAQWTHPNGHPRCLICGDEPVAEEFLKKKRLPSGYCLGRDQNFQEVKAAKTPKLKVLINPSKKPKEEPDTYIITDSKKCLWLKKGTHTPVFVIGGEKMKVASWLLEDMVILRKDQPVGFKGHAILWDGRKIKITKTAEFSAKRFVQQHHWRCFEHDNKDFQIMVKEKDFGKSVHVDWRFEMNDHLIGATLADANEGVVKEPVLTMEQARTNEKRSDIWKVDWNTGEPKTRRTETGEVREKIWCDFKAMQPKGWLTMEGVTPERKIEAVPGGTKEFPGVFLIFNKGTFDLGAQKPYFKEFFIHSPKVKGRIVFRQVAGLKETKKPLTWLYWKADDQTPYVLSRRAENAGWIPEGYSALPSDLEKKVPDSLNYWKKGLQTKERFERRSLLRKQYMKQWQQKEMSKGFILVKRHWKGQEVVRKLPVEDYHLRVAGKQFHLDKNPIWREDVSASQFAGEPEWFRIGRHKPDTKVNPNKKIPAFIDLVDKGEFEIERKEENLIQINFKGKNLKGMYIFKRTSPGDIWSLIKQKAPLMEKDIQFSFKNFSVKPVMSKDLSFPYPVHAVAFAEGTWHETFYPWEVIKKAAELMEGSPLVAWHEDGFFKQVGQITRIKPNDKKKWVECWGYLYDTEPGRHMATLLANGQVTAVSARVQEWTEKEDDRDVCRQIVGWPHVAFVRDPEVTIAKIIPS